jgi:hypothetical protein
MNSLYSTVEPFNNIGFGGGMSIAFGNGLNLTSNFDMRRLTAGEGVRGAWGKFVSVGLAYSSSTLPLSIW